jgi:hypothetical protein
MIVILKIGQWLKIFMIQWSESDREKLEFWNSYFILATSLHACEHQYPD